jgi:predicted tellurium resistance membrane protein TerC
MVYDIKRILSGLLDQLKTIEVSALIIISCTCIAFVCHVYMKFPFKIKDSTFFLIVLEKYRILG